MIRVHILATCLVPARIYSLLLVFKTLRVGFPTDQILIYGNNLDERIIPHLKKVMDDGMDFINIPPIAHGEWIEKLMVSEPGPFWICDTDIVFFDQVQDWKWDGLFAGRYEPGFFEPWTKTFHMSRLHPSLMWLNPVPLRTAIRSWPGKNAFFDTVESGLFRWHWVPEFGQPLKFYDTCAGLHHAFKGVAFTDEQDQSFAHLMCGSYGHLIKSHKNITMECYHNQELARPLLSHQKSWYLEHEKQP